MDISTQNVQVVRKGVCPNCGAKGNEQLRHCVTCQRDLGFPNVRECCEEFEALNARFEKSRGDASNRDTLVEFDGFVAAVSEKSRVVVSMRVLDARSFLSDKRSSYVNYETLVGAGVRQPAVRPHDAERAAVAGTFFGSYADQIVYGLLSMNGSGLINYGPIFFTLRPIAVEQRVTFLEENSYLFLEAHEAKVRESIPAGYRSLWGDRQKLAACKLATKILKNSSFSDWVHLLFTTGSTRANDSCIEAHIFGSFNAEAVEAVGVARPPTNATEQLDIDIILELAQQLSTEVEPK